MWRSSNTDYYLEVVLKYDLRQPQKSIYWIDFQNIQRGQSTDTCSGSIGAVKAYICFKYF